MSAPTTERWRKVLAAACIVMAAIAMCGGGGAYLADNGHMIIGVALIIVGFAALMAPLVKAVDDSFLPLLDVEEAPVVDEKSTPTIH